MGQDPDAIRDEVEQTRERMGETIDALGHKADVKTRAKENIGGKVETVKGGLGTAQENPIGLAVGAAAAGFLAGMLIPSSRVEDEKLGPMADQVKEQVKETGQEALERGKQVAQSAADTARDEAQEQGSGLADSAREHASSVSNN
jgi:hypothetical protein